MIMSDKISTSAENGVRFGLVVALNNVCSSEISAGDLIATNYNFNQILGLTSINSNAGSFSLSPETHSNISVDYVAVKMGIEQLDNMAITA